MLNVLELNNYLEECNTEIAAFGNFKLLADDDEFSKFSAQLSKVKDKVVLIGVLPNINGGGPDEDTAKANNRLMFFCVQKADTRQAYSEYIQDYQTTQTAIHELFKKFLRDHLNFDKRCMANNFSFNSWTIEPIRNYHQTNGWVLEIDVNTNM